MAFDFSLWINTGSSADDTERLSNFLKEQKMIQTKLNEYPVSTHFHKDSYFVKVGGISNIGIRSTKDALEMSLIGFEFFKLLINAPRFRYALVGIGLEKWRDLHEFVNYPKDVLLMKGFVVREDVYKKMETPLTNDSSHPSSDIGFFRKGYLWIPYLGEWEFPFK
ncbi:hypothetical protein BKI52_12865 [marine bacterium AO1-C]|nr:hypothetical protein BKI52_12865 [marine bacterium AO1-C]